jgi:hypothetical protein
MDVAFYKQAKFNGLELSSVDLVRNRDGFGRKRSGLADSTWTNSSEGELQGGRETKWAMETRRLAEAPGFQRDL